MVTASYEWKILECDEIPPHPTPEKTTKNQKTKQNNTLTVECSDKAILLTEKH